jgi:hypothetical protein
MDEEGEDKSIEESEIKGGGRSEEEDTVSTQEDKPEELNSPTKMPIETRKQDNISHTGEF